METHSHPHLRYFMKCKTVVGIALATTSLPMAPRASEAGYLFDVTRGRLRFVFFRGRPRRPRAARAAGWHTGQKCLLRPATSILLIVSPQRKHARPSRP